MSSKNDYHNCVMCNACDKVVRDDNSKRHMNAKHAETLNSMIPTEAQDLKLLTSFAEYV